MTRRLCGWVLGAVIFGLPAVPAAAQSGAPDGDWPHYAGDQGSTKYSPLDQIDRDNFARLRVAWRWRSGDEDVDQSDVRLGAFRGTPLKVGGRLFQPTGLSRVAAIDPATGETLWLYDPRSYDRGPVVHGLGQIRGLEYWTDGKAERILIATGGKQLVSIDAATGEPDPAFGEGGIVDLAEGLGRESNVRNVGHSAPVIVVGDTVVVGSIIFDFPTRDTQPPGHVRGYDIRTGTLKWRFHSIPQAGEEYVDTWENDSWKTAGNTNVWSMMSADPELGYVYLPFGTPTSDYYGGHRHGDNVYAESLVALDADTGERVWHFQAVHHGIWDYDFPCAPNLVDITVDGRRIKAVAQVSKQGMTYVFDRATGEPVWPIVEREVNAKSPVPGEKLSPTQPFPTKPPPFEELGVSEDMLIDFTPELRAEALEIVKDFVIGPIFTPTIVAGHDGKKATIVNPGAGGGANWPGASYDPETGILYVQSQTRPSAMSLQETDPARSDFRYMIGRGLGGMPTVQGLPLLKPPYRRITAIDLNRGEHAWQIPFGDGPREHPAIAHLDLGPLGSPFPAGVISEGGLLVTKTLLVTFQAKLDELGDRRARGSFLQAYDKATGALLAQVELDRSLHSSPMTYLHGGRQYIVVAGGGGRDEGAEPHELVAFALP
ncbi:MAG: pyrroloquinoline quinone-dependent dehydrogenase [Thermoanaerobaculia bacterium]|nr:pyrroloquinoline quinone-dependent dehydrogenase [Thermoanaerobaculia bacterium]